MKQTRYVSLISVVQKVGTTVRDYMWTYGAMGGANNDNVYNRR
jgi:hypothetical protein